MSSIPSRLLRSARSKSGGVQKLSVSYTVVVHALVLPATAGDTCSVTLERGPKDALESCEKEPPRPLPLPSLSVGTSAADEGGERACTCSEGTRVQSTWQSACSEGGVERRVRGSRRYAL